MSARATLEWMKDCYAESARLFRTYLVRHLMALVVEAPEGVPRGDTDVRSPRACTDPDPHSFQSSGSEDSDR